MSGLPPQERSQRLIQAIGTEGIPNLLATQLNVSYDREYGEGAAGSVLGGIAHLGKGVIEGGLGLARAAQWLGDLGKPDASKTENLIGKIPTDLRDILPTEQALRLESRLGSVPARRAFEIAGGVLPLVSGGGAAGAVGKIAGAPGSLISKLGAPAAKFGEKLIANAPKVGLWGKLAQHLPATLGTAQGFGLYNFLTTEGGLEERAASMLDGAWRGAALSVAGSLANATERAILSKSTSSAARRSFMGMREEMAYGNYGNTIRRLDANIIASAIEATGFAGLDKQFWADTMAGINGDQEAQKRALETYAGSLAGVLLARTGRTDAMRDFRRDAPDLNTLETRLLVEDIRSPKKPQDPTQAPQPPSGQGGQKLLQAPQSPSGDSVNTAWRMPKLNEVSNPLFKSGWEAKPGVEQDGGRQIITMQFPGAGEIRMWENEMQAGPSSEAFGLEVPVDVFRQVRGKVEIPEGTENIRMVGKVAEEFSRDLAALSILRRIKGEIYFGKNGEARAGGPWKGDGGYDTIGLDGKPYKQGVFPEDGFKPGGELPPLPAENGSSQDPQMQRWVQLAQDLRDNTAPNPGLDLLESSLMLALRGDPQASRSVQELQKLLMGEWQPGVMNADLVANVLGPDTIEQFGLTVGQVAAGHLTAEAAAAQLGTVFLGQAKGTQLPAPADVQQDVDALPTGQSGNVAGERDWFGSATPPERRDAARQYAQQNPEATSAVIRDTFGVPRETARDILSEVKSGREGEAGFFRPGDVLVAAADAVSAVGKTVKGVYDYAIPTTASLIAKQGGEAGAEFGSAIREIQSRTRAIIGKAGPAADAALSPKMTKKQKLARVGARFRQGLSRMEMRQIELGEKKGKMSEPRWVGLIEGRIEPSDAFEKQFAENGREALLELKREGRKSGMLMQRPGKEGDVYFEIPDTDKVTVPRVYDLYSRNNFLDLMGNESARKAFFDALARLNPDAKMTGADLEDRWLKSKSVDKRLSDAEREAALEHIRTYDNVPATFTHDGTRYNVLEKDPAVAIMSIINRQASRIATVDVVGQDLPIKVQKAFGITKPGMSSFLADKTKRVAAVSAETVPIMEKLSQRVQAGEPEVLPRSARAYATATAVRRALMASMSWAYDIPAAGVEPVVAIGLQRTIAAAVEVLREFGSNTKFAEEFGTLAVEMAHLDMGMARNPLERMAEIISTPGKITEEIKTVFHTRVADLYIRSLASGKAKTNDRAYLEGVVKLTPDEAASILDGTAPDTLKDRAVREVVQVWTARGRPSERSRAASSPIVRLLVDFTGYATRRAEQVVAETVTFSKVLGRPSSTVGERADAANRLIKRYVGMAPAGIISAIIGAMIVDLLSDMKDLVTGEVTRIPGERVVRQLVNYPVKTIYKAAMQQLASGPIAQFVDTLTGQNENPERMVAPLVQVGALGKGINRALSGHSPWETIRRFAEEAGFWPTWMTRTAGSLFMSAADKRYEVARSTVSEWERMEGLQKTYGDRQKAASFYAAMSDVAKIIRDHVPEKPGDVWDKIEPVISKALEVDTRDAAANRLRGMRLLAGKTKEQLSSLQDYMGSDRYRAAVDHDMLLSEMARFVSSIDNGGKMPEWSESLAVAAKLAKDGTPNSFSNMMERAVSDMSASLIAGSPRTADVDELALTMAGYPEAIQRESSFSEAQKEALGRASGDREYVHRILMAILMNRAKSGAMKDLRESSKEK